LYVVECFYHIRPTTSTPLSACTRARSSTHIALAPQGREGAAKWKSLYNQVIRITRPIVTQAGLVLERHPLRAYDAVQLACALAVQRLLHQRGMPPPLFVTADDALLVAARAEGFPVDTPLQHP
jgi:hypothetical protein